MKTGSKARGCLIALAVVVALAATVIGVVGPGLFRRAQEIYAPVRKMKADQQDFAAWSKQQAWHEPAVATLNTAQLDKFLRLRTELQKLEEDAPRRREPGDRRPHLRDMPNIMGSVSTFVSARFEAFRRSGTTDEEYRYLEHLVYVRWLAALRGAGQDPAVLERVAQEILNTAHDEHDATTAARLRAAAARVRQRKPAAPAGVPEEVHALLLERASEIEALTDPSSRGLVPDQQ